MRVHVVDAKDAGKAARGTARQSCLGRLIFCCCCRCRGGTQRSQKTLESCQEYFLEKRLLYKRIKIVVLCCRTNAENGRAQPARSLKLPTSLLLLDWPTPFDPTCFHLFSRTGKRQPYRACLLLFWLPARSLHRPVLTLALPPCTLRLARLVTIRLFISRLPNL